MRACGCIDHSQMPSMVRLNEATGEAFDAAFLAEMIEHHQGAVDMAEGVAKDGKRGEVKEAAQKIIPVQKKGSRR